MTLLEIKQNHGSFESYAKHVCRKHALNEPENTISDADHSKELERQLRNFADFSVDLDDIALMVDETRKL